MFFLLSDPEVVLLFHCQLHGQFLSFASYQIIPSKCAAVGNGDDYIFWNIEADRLWGDTTQDQRYYQRELLEFTT